jgi:hypothetical protein
MKHNTRTLPESTWRTPALLAAVFAAGIATSLLPGAAAAFGAVLAAIPLATIARHLTRTQNRLPRNAVPPNRHTKTQA